MHCSIASGVEFHRPHRSQFFFRVHTRITKNDPRPEMSCKACEELPPVSAEYTEKGKYETIAGLKTCK